LIQSIASPDQSSGAEATIEAARLRRTRPRLRRVGEPNEALANQTAEGDGRKFSAQYPGTSIADGEGRDRDPEPSSATIAEINEISAAIRQCPSTSQNGANAQIAGNVAGPPASPLRVKENILFV